MTETLDMMKDYPFYVLKDNQKEYITKEYIKNNFSEEQLHQFIDNLSEKELFLFSEVKKSWGYLARKNQRLPSEEHDGVMFLGGRGSGKTRSAAEAFIFWCMSGKYQRCNMIGPTERDVEMTMILGPSGIKSICDERGIKIEWNKGDRMIKWPNGTVTLYFSAEKPESLRGVNSSKIWMDEVVAWEKDIEYIFDMMLMGLRLDDDPSWMISTTPKNEDNKKAQKFLRDRYKDPRVITLYSFTFDNDALPAKTIQMLRNKYTLPNGELSELGQQELMAQLKLTDDVDGPVFTKEQIEKYKVDKIPENVSIIKKIVSIDPSVSDTKKSDECGIVVLYLASNEKIYVVEDLSGHYKAEKWSEIAIKAYYRHRCSLILAETNQGGDLVKNIIERRDENIKFKEVKATLSKKDRAIPVGEMYTMGTVVHVGNFETLESQMLDFEPTIKKKGESPDRVDALVHGCTLLEKDIMYNVSRKIEEYKELTSGMISEKSTKSKRHDNVNNNSQISYFKEFNERLKKEKGLDLEKLSIFNR